MENVVNFLKKYHMSIDDVNVDETLECFEKTIAKGLTSKNTLAECSIPMIPTFLTANINERINEKIIVVDAGGTNLRVGLAFFDGKDWQLEDIKETKMPGIEREYSNEEFFDYIASNMLHVLDKATNIGFCFSYQVAMDASLDGKLVAWAKEIKAKEVVGKYVGKELLNAIKKYSDVERKIVVLNDTTAVLLGGKTLDAKHKYKKYVGAIYGTGFNCCYIEENKNILKVNDLAKGNMIINTETGNFAGFKRGAFDEELTNESALVDEALTEKMSSGRYLASLIYKATSKAIEEGLISSESKLINYDDFTLPLVSMNLAGVDTNLNSCFANLADKQVFVDIAFNLIERAAKVVATTISAFVIKSDIRKIGIIIEGSTFYKLPTFKEKFTKYLDEILKSRKIKYELFDGRNRILIGAALAGMLN